MNILFNINKNGNDIKSSDKINTLKTQNDDTNVFNFNNIIKNDYQFKISNKQPNKPTNKRNHPVIEVKNHNKIKYLFHKYDLNISDKNKEIPYDCLKHSIFDNHYICHYHIYDLDKYNADEYEEIIRLINWVF